MERHFADEYREAEGRGARRRYVLRAVLDVLATAPAELARALRQDLGFALRVYRKSPGSTAIAVTVLAIGMAFVSAFVSLYVDLAMKPFPGLEGSGRLVTIAQVNDVQSNSVPFRFTERIAEDVAALEAAVGVGSSYQEILHEGERVRMEYGSQGLFEVIRPKLAIGRGFVSAEHAFEAEPVIVLSNRYWRDVFGASPDVIGETIELDPPQQTGVDREPTTFRIIGVMAPEMRGLMSDEVDVWVPFEQFVLFLNGDEADYQRLRQEAYVYTLARLRTGASAKALMREVEARYPEAHEEFGLGAGFRIDAVDGVVPDVQAHRAAESQLQLFLAGSLLLALVAAANVSLFLFARAPGRRRELAIRMSVGAAMRRLARQLMTESALLVVVSAMLGLLMSIWLANFLQGMAFLRQADWGNVTMLDWRVLSLVGCFLLILTLLVSLAPILGLKQLGIAGTSRQVAARATPVQRIAGTVQVAIAGGLGGTAIAFVWFIGSMVLGDPGYETRDRYVVSLMSTSFVPGGAATATIEATRHRELIEALPGVDAVSFSFLVPGQNLLTQRRVHDPVDPSREIAAFYGSIDGRFVDVLGLRLLHGRAPGIDEIGVSLVNESLARLLYGRQDVVGEKLEAEAVMGMERDVARTTEIIGVLEDVSFRHPAAAPGPMLFTNVSPPRTSLSASIVESGLTGDGLRQELQGLLDSRAIQFDWIGSLVPLADFRDRRIAPDRARALLTISTASLVVVLTAIGLYGTQRYLVAAGRREYAIRAALGAGPRALARLVFRRGFMLVLPGLVAGALLAFLLVAWLRDDYLSREISPGVVAVAVVIGVASLMLAASLAPAREARVTRPAPLLSEE